MNAPVVLPLPFRDPAEAFAPHAERPFAVLLDSARVEEVRGRWAYIALNPFQTVVAVRGQNPFDLLEAALRPYQQSHHSDLPPFQGGAIGYVGYEAGRSTPSDQQCTTLPDMVFGLYDVVVAFDLIERKAWVISTGLPEQEPHRRKVRAERRARELSEWLAQTVSEPEPQGSLLAQPWQPELSRADYLQKVGRVVEYIRAGDIYQANLTQRFLATRRPEVSAYALYRQLRQAAPAPFSAFLRLEGDAAIASASPERFLRVDANGHVETRPIKGTRPRGRTPDEDAALAQELRDSAKDCAENLMIVDLLRNDLSRVCRVGSVKVPALCGLESFPAVHHLVSVVEGELQEGRGALDLLRASFPGGSITGAPKIRAMEILHELEPAERGPYCGSIAWIGFDGAMDSSIVIRTLVIDGPQVIAQAGGGIVADSDPDAEYAETLVKARPLMQALDPAMPWPPAFTQEPEPMETA